MLFRYKKMVKKSSYDSFINYFNILCIYLNKFKN